MNFDSRYFTRKPINLDYLNPTVPNSHPDLNTLQTVSEEDLLPKNIWDDFCYPMPDYFILLGKNGNRYLIHTAGYDYIKYAARIES